MERNVFLQAFAKQNIGALVWDNPIVLRDLRATMRGTRAFWMQGIYLLLLGIIALTGYASATGQSLLTSPDATTNHPVVFDIVNAQWRLQQFYYFIFVTLAALITLIAPALTATSVSDERQRQSLDLLITTPLSAAELLVGKLMSSLAFLGLLLLLSLPASVLCILLGGATIGDVFRIYFMLAIDAVVLASIGLYFSCACKNSFLSLIWTYCSVALFTGVMFYIGMGASYAGNTGYQIGTQAGAALPFAAIAALSPFSTLVPGASQSIAIGPLSVPIWVALIPVAFVTVRLILTAAAYRLGMFGGAMAHSLRKQILGVTAFAMLTLAYSTTGSNGFLHLHDTPSDEAYRTTLIATWIVFTALFCIAVPFLPGLFVPVRAEDAPPGETQDAHDKRDGGIFQVQAMLHPRHSGALPYYLTWFATAVAGIMGGILLNKGWSPYLPGAIAAVLVYVGGAGTLLWGFCRLAAQWIRSAPAARALGFGLFMLMLFIPGFVLAIVSMNIPDWKTADAMLFPLLFWLGSPFMCGNYSLFQDSAESIMKPVLLSGFAALITGAVIGMIAKPKQV